MMIINYFKMKAAEIRLKLMLYTKIETLISNQSEIAETIQKLYIAMQGKSVQELQESFIHELAQIIHDENQKDKKDGEGNDEPLYK